MLLPNPVAVYDNLSISCASGEFIDDLEITLGELAAAFAISVTSGVTLGYLISRSPYAIEVFEPLFAAIYAIPIILFLPLFVLFFGLGPASKIALGAAISFFPVVINTIAGFGHVDRLFVTAARSMGASDYHLFRHVLLPAALPVILTGLRMGFTTALLSIIGSETLASLAGLGHRIVHLAEAMEMARMFAYIVFVIAIAVILNTVVSTLEARGKRELMARPSSPLGISCAFVGALADAAHRHRGPVRPLGNRGALVRRSAVPQPAVAGDRRRSARCSTPAACRRRCSSPCSSSTVAFVLAVAIGLVLGLAIGLQPFVRRSFFPIVLLLYGMPQVTILPLFILFFGIGAASKIAFGVTHGVFPIIVTVVAGVQNLKPILLTSARSMGASRWQIFRHVIFPHMVPSFFAGMRLGMSGVLLGVLLAELYVSIAGIGYFTTLFTQNFDPTKLLGLIGVLAAMAIVLNAIVRRAETHFARWRTG